MVLVTLSSCLGAGQGGTSFKPALQLFNGEAIEQLKDVLGEVKKEVTAEVPSLKGFFFAKQHYIVGRGQRFDDALVLG